MTDAAQHDAVTVDHRDTVTVITIDDGKVNALSHGVLDAIGAALDDAEARESGAVVLAGRPGVFSAGFDLKTMQAGPDQARDLLAKGAELAVRTYELPVPLVAAATGHALAMGAIWLLGMDVRIGAEGAFKLGMNEVAIGMPVPAFAIGFARDRLTPAEVLPAVQLARIYDPAAAVAAGYLDRAVPAEQVLDVAVAEAERLAATLNRGAFRATRSLLRAERAAALREALASDVSTFFVS